MRFGALKLPARASVSGASARNSRTDGQAGGGIFAGRGGGGIGFYRAEYENGAEAGGNARSRAAGGGTSGDSGAQLFAARSESERCGVRRCFETADAADGQFGSRAHLLPRSLPTPPMPWQLPSATRTRHARANEWRWPRTRDGLQIAPSKRIWLGRIPRLDHGRIVQARNIEDTLRISLLVQDRRRA